MRLEVVHDRAQLDTMATYASQPGGPARGREVDVRKLQLQMDPGQQAAEGRQQVRAVMLLARSSHSSADFGHTTPRPEGWR